jgi:UDP:flavonoid glycosyltransferase YjiC (YdhE family)
MQKKVLFTPIVDNISETLRCILVAKELKKLGYEIFFGGSGKFEYLINANSFDLFKLDEIPLEKLTYLENDKGTLSFYTLDECRTFVKQRLSYIRKIKPDLVVLGGPSFTTQIACRIAGISTCSIAAAAAYDFLYQNGLGSYSDQWRFPGISLIPEKALRKFANWYFLRTKLFMGIYNRVLREYEKPPFESLIKLFQGDLKLVSDARELYDIPDNKITDGAKFIGPIIPFKLSKIDKNVADDIKKNAQGRKIVYFSIGSTGSREVYIKLAKELANKPYYVIISTLGKVKKKEINILAENICIYDELLSEETINAQNEVVDLMVCHGGAGTLYSALSFGNPIIGIPQQYEQECNIDTIVRNGLGLKANYRKLDVVDISNKIQIILNDPNYSKRAEAMQKIIKRYNAPATAAMEIDNFL